MKLAVPPNAIETSDKEFFKEERPVTRIRTDVPLQVKVLVNFAPERARRQDTADRYQRAGLDPAQYFPRAAHSQVLRSSPSI